MSISFLSLGLLANVFESADPRRTIFRMAAVALVFSATHGLAAPQSAIVGIVDLYGLRQLQEGQVRAALRISEGDTIKDSVLKDAEKRLRALPGVIDARVDRVCCDDGKTIVYAGVQEKDAPTLRFLPAPRKRVRLPDDVVRAGKAFDAAFAKAIERGDLAEDQSQGHALMHDPGCRAVQEGFVALADQHGQRLREVLRESDRREERALAAQILGYASDKASVIGDLTTATRDPDDDTRNNATRALWIIAVFAQKSAGPGLRVPAEPFVDLLNSLTWSDRNKASLALMALSEPRDAALLTTLRQKALPALTEMARWKSKGHAVASVVLLARVAGISEKDIAAAASRGDHGTLIEAALKRLPAPHRPAGP